MKSVQLCFDFYNDVKVAVVNTAKRLKKTLQQLCLNLLPLEQTQSQQMNLDFGEIIPKFLARVTFSLSVNKTIH